MVEAAQKAGAPLIAEGEIEPTSPGGGYYVRPALFGPVDPQSDLAQREVFGPVLALIPFEDEADAIRIANGLLACGGVAALSLYWLGWFDEHQWQPLGLGFGGGSTAALLALAVLPLVWGGAPRDAFVAYAISQRAPAWLLYFFMTALAASFPAAVWSLLA